MINVIDLDGTISFQGAQISPTLMAVIHKLEAQHHTMVFVSARQIRDMLTLLKKDSENNFYID